MATIIDLAYEVLREAGEPLHYKELTKRINERGLQTSSADSVSGTISQNINKNPNKSRFFRPSKGIIALKNRALKNRKDAGTAAKTASDTSNTVSILEAVEEVLKRAGEPMHYTKITEIAIGRKLIAPTGRTPQHSLNARVGADIKKRSERGAPPLFVKRDRGMIGLANPADPADSMPEDVAAIIDKHNQRVYDELLRRVMEKTPREFEDLVTELIVALGFEDVDQTPLSGDDGIDVHGTLVISDEVRVDMAVQAKRWGKNNNVGAPTVRNVRGSLKDHQHGMIITTGKFTPKAKEDASSGNKKPITLVDGRSLAKLLAANGIGVERKSYDLLTLGRGGLRAVAAAINPRALRSASHPPRSGSGTAPLRSWSVPPRPASAPSRGAVRRRDAVLRGRRRWPGRCTC